MTDAPRALDRPGDPRRRCVTPEARRAKTKLLFMPITNPDLGPGRRAVGILVIIAALAVALVGA